MTDPLDAGRSPDSERTAPDLLSADSGEHGVMPAVADDRRPAPALFASVAGQETAKELLRGFARRPVHAYLLSGGCEQDRRGLWRAFAAALLCPDGGCGICAWCKRALEGRHPDFTEIGPVANNLSVEEARAAVRTAQRKPIAAARQVIVVNDIHRGYLATPVLLKTVEEPPPHTVFVLATDSTPRWMATIVSRCVSIELAPPQSHGTPGSGCFVGEQPQDGRRDALDGADRHERASDAPLEGDAATDGDTYLAVWATIPERLQYTGQAVASLAAELASALDLALRPVQKRHTEALKELAGEEEMMGGADSAVRNRLEERQHRELRRARTDLLREGMNRLAGIYRVRLAAEPGGVPSPATADRLRRLDRSERTLAKASAALVRNPNETLLIESLLLDLASPD